MMSEFASRRWWIFEMPDGSAYVPGENEEEARSNHARHLYPGAPEGSFRCVGRILASRFELASYLLRGMKPEATSETENDYES